SERCKRHRIEAVADAGITGSKFSGFLQRNLLPEPREMKNAKWTGSAGTDQWNICVSHSSNSGNPARNGMQVVAHRNLWSLPTLLRDCHSERSEESRMGSGWMQRE